MLTVVPTYGVCPVLATVMVKVTRSPGVAVATLAVVDTASPGISTTTAEVQAGSALPATQLVPTAAEVSTEVSNRFRRPGR